MTVAFVGILRREQIFQIMAETSTYLSYADYCAAEALTDRKHEYWDGQMVPRPDVTVLHAQLASWANWCLHEAKEQTGLIAYIMSSQGRIHIQATMHSLYPTLSVSLAEPETPTYDPHSIVNPTLLVEIHEESFDHLRRFHHYRHLPSFQEYVLISQKEYEVTTHFHQGEDLWEIKTYRDRAAIIPLKSLGCEVRMTDLYRRVEF